MGRADDTSDINCHLLARKKLRELEIDPIFTNVKELLISMGEPSDRDNLIKSVERDLIKSLMVQLEKQKEENEQLRKAKSSSESLSSASSPPGEPTSLIGRVSDTLLGKRKDG